MNFVVASPSPFKGGSHSAGVPEHSNEGNVPQTTPFSRLKSRSSLKSQRDTGSQTLTFTPVAPITPSSNSKKELTLLKEKMALLQERHSKDIQTLQDKIITLEELVKSKRAQVAALQQLHSASDGRRRTVLKESDGSLDKCKPTDLKRSLSELVTQFSQGSMVPDTKDTETLLTQLRVLLSPRDSFMDQKRHAKCPTEYQEIPDWSSYLHRLSLLSPSTTTK